MLVVPSAWAWTAARCAIHSSAVGTYPGGWSTALAAYRRVWLTAEVRPTRDKARAAVKDDMVVVVCSERKETRGLFCDETRKETDVSMGNSPSTPKITSQDRAILEYAC